MKTAKFVRICRVVYAAREMRVHATSVVLAAAVCAIATVCASAVDIGTMPSWEYADTEVSTNCPLSMARNPMENVRFSMSFAGGASNNVEVAFGHDSNTNGVLEVCERGLELGWDCGEWFMRTLGEPGYACQPATTNSLKQFDFFMHVSAYAPQTLRCRENGVRLDWGFAAGIPQWAFDPAWDTLRLTVRGVEGGGESLGATVKVEGTEISLR